MIVKDALGAKVSTNVLMVAQCQGCERQLGNKVYDCPTAHGPWGHLCPECAKRIGHPSCGTVHENLSVLGDGAR